MRVTFGEGRLAVDVIPTNAPAEISRKAGVLIGGWLTALRRYIVVIGLGNLVWEFAQLPLYTIWHTGSPGEILFAVLHCTGGDIVDRRPRH